MGDFQTPISIFDALEKIRTNDYLLPSFQREFEWEESDICKLFDSILRGYPVGSMLFWEIDGNVANNVKVYYFNENFIENPDRVKHGDKFKQNMCAQFPQGNIKAILDGQQRLTALRVGIYGKYYRHQKNKSWDYNDQTFDGENLYLALKENTSFDDDDRKYIFEFKNSEDIIFVDKDSSKWYKVYDIVNFYRDSKDTGIETGEYYKDYNLENDEKKLINLLKTSIFLNKPINYYLETTKDVDMAMQIFARINSGGKKLSNLKIIFSIIKATWKTDARQNIENLIDSVKNMGFDIDIEYVTKAFIFLYSKNVKNEIKAFDHNFCKMLEGKWKDINNSILCLFRLLRVYKFTGDNLTSKNATLPLLYYIYHKKLWKNFDTAIKYENERKEMKKWLCAVLLRKVFSGQSDTALSQARKGFGIDFDNNVFISNTFSFSASAINKNIERITVIDEESLDNILNTQYENSNSLLVLSLLYPDKKYFSTEVHKDHVHPKEKCKAVGIPFDKYNSIVNLQLLADTENESKSKKDLLVWANLNGYSTNKKQFLDEHIIPDVDLNLSNFDKYYNERKQLLNDKLKILLS